MLTVVMETAIKVKAKRRHLSESECSSLAQGSPSITLPFSVNLFQKDPNHGLQPRSPTKRRRKDERLQRGITEFFSSNGVLSSSPQKSNNRVVLKTDAGLKDDRHQDKDDEEKMQIDFMEGITAEMFEDDDTDECSFKREEKQEGKAGYTPVSLKDEDVEYDIESLPDAHYGLLGLNTNLLVPQGQFQDLPEEVLSAIFAYLPAIDLYRHISLVCQGWRKIVMDPQFLPWKKLYCRYEKQEKGALKEVRILLDKNRIVKTNDLCLLNFVRYMSQFKHSKRINVTSVLMCLKKHRLFVQAEACIKHRMPDMDTVDGGPNPWSTMALLLIFADSVNDILDLVNFLRTCDCALTPSLITEFLWAVATLLLAMKNTNIIISNRWHYNIYYVLHLMENAPPLYNKDTREKQIHVTHEQQQILSHNIQSDHIVKIMAFAGTGKTTALVKYAQQRPDLRFLYVAFNKSVATHAKQSFPSNVECRTIHSMAYKAVGHRYKMLNKQGNNIQPFTVAWVLPKGRGGFVNAKVVTQTINNYLSSTDEHIGTQHVPLRFINNSGHEEYPDENKKRDFADDAQVIWTKMAELKPTKNAAYYMSHDGYLKLWQLQRPKLDDYDVIFIDEAQDCTPVVMEILLSQRCGKILVGDPHQQIYTFRGAVNALHSVHHTHIYYLTQSFRFGPEISYIGATLLHVCKRVKKILVGGRQNGIVRGEDRETFESLQQAHSQIGGKVAILCRCNVSVFSEAVRLTEINRNCKIHIVGGVENFGLQRILDIWILMQPETKQRTENLRIKDPFIRNFCSEKMGGYAGLKKYATHTEDRELEAKLSVVEKFSKRIPELINRIYNCAQSQPNCADYILGTVHKSKGLEFDTVVVTDDFIKVPCSLHNLRRMNMSSGIRNADADEWNLLYVAVTRAKRALFITKSISNILTLAGEYFLRSELSNVLLNQDHSRRCCIRDCPNHITKDTPLSIRKLPIRYIDSVDEGGVLCAACVEQRVGPMAFLLSSPESVKQLHYTEERLELPINISMLLALL